MKKALLIALLAMMLISMLVTACKPKVEEPVEVAPVEEVAPVVDTTAVAPVDPAATTTPAPVK